MGAATIVDVIKTLVDGLSVTGGGHTVAFSWAEWEALPSKRGPHVSAQMDLDEYRSADIGGGAANAEELVRLRFRWETAKTGVEWSLFKDALKVAVKALIRSDEHSLGPGYWCEVLRVVYDAGTLEGTGRTTAAVTFGQADVFVRSQRDEVYA